MVRAYQIFFVLLSIILSGCSKKNKPGFIYNVPKEGIVLTQWHVIGPFPANSETNFFDKDNLSHFGYSESTITFNEFRKISKHTIKDTTILPDNFVSRLDSSLSDVVDLNGIFGYEKMEQAISGNAYLACTIYSDKPRELMLNFTSDDCGKVWVNHKEVLRLEKAEGIIAYEKYVPISLQKGENLVMMKVYNGMFDWQVYAKLENLTKEGTRRHQKLSFRLNNHNFFKNSLIDSSGTLSPSEKLPSERLPVAFYDENNTLLRTDTVSSVNDGLKSLSGYKDGYYYAKMILNNDTMQQPLYKGDIINDTKAIIEKIKSEEIQDKEIIDCINANVHRFNHLLKPENRGSSLTDKQFWQRKLIYLYLDLQSMLVASQHNTNPLKDSPGIHIRAYTSEIDSQAQYYILHVPKKYNKNISLPLVVYMPAKLPNHQPYLESMRVADLKLIENLQDMSDKHNVIVLEPFCREVGKLNFNAIEETDFFEALKSAKRNYNIDTTKIFITGTCEGAYKAIKFAVRYPTVFTAIGLISPSFRNTISKRLWASQGEPLDYIKNVSNHPILIIHSKLDKHTGIESSDEFAALAKENGLENFEYRRLDDVIDLYYWYEFSDDIFTFFDGHLNRKMPTSVHFSTNQLKYNKSYWLKILEFNSMNVAKIEATIKNNTIQVTTESLNKYAIDLRSAPLKKGKPIKIIENGTTVFKGHCKTDSLFENSLTRNANEQGLAKSSTIEGPLAHVFTNNFLIVMGSAGSAEENKAIKVQADSLQSWWKYKYMCNSKAKYDYQLTPQDIETSNLVVIGNFNSNTVLKQLSGKIPLEIKKDQVAIGNYKVAGENLCFYMVYPNPMNSKKYIAIFGYNNPSFISLGKLDMNDDEYENLIKQLKNEVYIDISCLGWYDYKIWNKKLLPQRYGYFNFNWN